MRILCECVTENNYSFPGTEENPMKPLVFIHPETLEIETAHYNDRNLMYDCDYENAGFEYVSGYGWCYPVYTENAPFIISKNSQAVMPYVEGLKKEHTENNAVKNIFGCIIFANNWTQASARFQIWASQFGLSGAESLAYILAGQDRLGEYETTQELFHSAKNKLAGKLPEFLDFTKEDTATPQG